MRPAPRFIEAGDSALVVELGDAIDPAINDRVRGLMSALESRPPTGATDIVPSYRSLLISYDPFRIGCGQLIEAVEEAERGLEQAPPAEQRVLTLPTLYGGEHGPDIDYVAEHAGIDAEGVRALHGGVDYRVYMIGFAPGFPYLGGLPERLATPRLESPRLRIPAGSVGIAESQTGIYPSASPGGWRLIGRTPVRLFDPDRDPPSLVVAGDYIRFVPLESAEEYEDMAARIEAGNYTPELSAAAGRPA